MPISGQAKRRAWARAYRLRMNLGLERCRKCGYVGDEMTWGHLTPESKGGTFTAANITILCKQCNGRQRDRIDPALRPLCDEPDFQTIVREWSDERSGYPKDRQGAVGGDLRDLPSTTSNQHAPQEEGWAGLDSVQRAALMRIWLNRLPREGD